MTNEQRRAKAEAAGAMTFRYEVVEHWRGCVACGQPIRRTVTLPGRRGLFRGCGCPGVVWRHDLTIGAWTREADR